MVQQQRRCFEFGSYAETSYFFNIKEYGRLNLAGNSPKVAYFFLHMHTSAKFYPVTQSNRASLEKIRTYMIGGASSKTVVDETLICNSSNISHSIFGIDAGLLYFIQGVDPYRQDYIPDMNSTQLCKESDPNKARQEALNYGHVSIKLECRIESFYTTGTEKDWLLQCIWVLHAMQHCVWRLFCFHQYLSCKEARFSLTKESLIIRPVLPFPEKSTKTVSTQTAFCRN